MLDSATQAIRIGPLCLNRPQTLSILSTSLRDGVTGEDGDRIKAPEREVN